MLGKIVMLCSRNNTTADFLVIWSWCYNHRSPEVVAHYALCAHELLFDVSLFVVQSLLVCFNVYAFFASCSVYSFSIIPTCIGTICKVNYQLFYFHYFDQISYF